MAWWLWIVFGLVFLVLELFVPSGFFICIVGLAAIITGLLSVLGLMGPAWVQWIFCGVLSGVLLMVVRKHLLGIQVSGGPSSGLQLGQTVVASSDLEPGAEGRGEMRGVSWSLLNVGTSVIKAGERCVIESVEGVTLKVRSTQK